MTFEPLPSFSGDPRRIVATNPDGLGDLMLREPLYRGLLDEGYALLLIVRENNAWLARHLFGEAEVVSVTFNPYERERLTSQDREFATLLSHLQSWRADTLLMTPFNQTSLEKSLATLLTGVECFTGGQAVHGRLFPEGEENFPELAMNHALLEMLVKQPRPQRRPLLFARAPLPGCALKQSFEAPFSRERLWIASLGTDPSQRDRGLANWSEEKWVELLKYGISTHDLCFLLIGTKAEEDAHKRITQQLGEAASRVQTMSDLAPEELIQLLYLAKGYLGRDTGVAHLAAAANLPVLTTIGGGHEARFAPMAERGRSFTVELPCSNCHWACPLTASWCVKAIPLSLMKEALDDIIAERAGDYQLIKLEPTVELVTRINEESAAALRGLSSVQSSDVPVRSVHIGHHFFGAGNLGDDLMLAGFLHAVRCSGLPLRLTCCIPHDRGPMKLRFPEIEWLPYTPVARMDAIMQADHWLGLGDTPFQTDGGIWFAEHLREENALCRAAGKNMYFLGCGVGNVTALDHPYLREIIHEARMIWTRDEASFEALNAHAPGKVRAGADLANIYLGSAELGDPVPGSAGLLLNFENENLFSEASLETLIERRRETHWYWMSQESRSLPGSEQVLVQRLPEHLRSEMTMCFIDYESATLKDLMATWPSVELLFSSRYHGALVGAWSGARLICLQRNDKLAGLARQLEVPLMTLTDESFALQALVRAKNVSRTQLRKLEHQASTMCEEYLALIPDIKLSVNAVPAPSVVVARQMMQSLLGENRVQRLAAEERLTSLTLLNEECERLRKSNVKLREKLKRMQQSKLELHEKLRDSRKSFVPDRRPPSLIQGLRDWFLK